jgi:phosphoglycerol transferase MdoB-like AlkP superfamily enzyme
VLSVQLCALLLLVIFRLCFFYIFQSPSDTFDVNVFLLGLRYDARLVAALGVIMLLLGGVPFLNPHRKKSALVFWNGFVAMLSLVLLLTYTADFYHYDYLKQRLNASVLQFLEDAAISMGMVWQTYPVIPATTILMVAVLAITVGHRFLLSKNSSADQVETRPWFRISHYAVYGLLMGLLMFGRLSQYPLRWSDAFVFSDSFKSATALNPFQSFFSSLAFRDIRFNPEIVRKGYPVIASQLGVDAPDVQTLDFSRTTAVSSAPDSPMNVVVVICESFAASKSSMFGNALNPTPYFNQLSQQGLFFERCFTPAFGTARGVWAVVTGIPDVTSSKTASRNPAAVDQYTLINAFSGYEKFYFLGGSTTWANIRGLLKNNVPDLTIVEEDDFKAGKVDVWGISDKNLFLESNQRFRQCKKPFFAVIQTADNHRPYTIPEEDLVQFKKQMVSKAQLQQSGFDDIDQLNAFRYMDYCFQVFMDTARQESYFQNTLFVFVGDHGLRGHAGQAFPAGFTQSGIVAEHVPLLFYAPSKIKPARFRSVCSQLDVLPTAASIAKIPHVNKTMGIDLTQNKRKQAQAFIADPDRHTIGMVTDSVYYSYHLPSGKEEVVSVIDDRPLTGASIENAKKILAPTARYWYETAGYLILNNKKRN